MPIKEGTAGWTIPRQNAASFPAEGSSLERYATRFPIVEVNSSFHREHRISTWKRWHDSVPADFRFSVKVPKAITHQAKLRDCSALLENFLEQSEALGEKLGVLLVQLPPKFEFEAQRIRMFFQELKAGCCAKIACEPRNLSWFTPEGDRVLEELQVARVAADPAISSLAATPGGWLGFHYWRLHGSPLLYRSSYSDRIDAFAEKIVRFAGHATDAWCIFDNTASSAAVGDALAMANTVRERLFMSR